jgi:phosphoglycolate phosphatase
MCNTKLVLFDADGVLIDSLTQHLEICRDLAKKLEVRNAKIPSPNQFRKMVLKGTQISPMENFFKALGFNQEEAHKANEIYLESFSDKYSLKPFPETLEMFRTLNSAGFSLGIVSSNTIENIRKPLLGQGWEYIDESLVFTKQKDISFVKHEAIKKAIVLKDLKPEQVYFIGDQLDDWYAAINAGVNFLGVSYGWCFTTAEARISTVSRCSEIASFILSRRSAKVREHFEKAWEKCKEASFSEKQWMNDRLSWLFMPQSILFAAFTFSLKADNIGNNSVLAKVIQTGLPLIGILISIIIYSAVISAAIMHRKWFCRLEILAKQLPSEKVTFGSKPYWPAIIARWVPPQIPLIFLALWVVLLFFVNCNQKRNNLASIQNATVISNLQDSTLIPISALTSINSSNQPLSTKQNISANVSQKKIKLFDPNQKSKTK